MEAVVGELVGGDVDSDGSGRDGVDQERSDEFVEVVVGVGDVRALMQGQRDLGVVVAVCLVADGGVGVEDDLESRSGVVVFVSYLGEHREVASDLAFVPGEEDRFDVGEVLVERGSSDAGVFGDARHRDREQAIVGDERRGGVEHRVADLAPVLVDRVGPQLGHPTSIHRAEIADMMTLTETLCLYKTCRVVLQPFGAPVKEISVADLPRHPEANDEVGLAAGSRSSTRRPVIVYAAVAVVVLLVVVMIILHLSGVVGPGAH